MSEINPSNCTSIEGESSSSVSQPNNNKVNVKERKCESKIQIETPMKDEQITEEDADEFEDICAEISLENDKKTANMNISFCGCGFLGIYHVGVAKCLVTHGRRLLPLIKRYAGASAGSLAACALAILPDRMDECLKFTYLMAKDTRSRPLGALTPGFNLSTRLRTWIDEFLPPNAHELATDRVFISVTCLHGRKNELVSKYDTREDLIQALLCSCHIPYYVDRKYPEFMGQKYFDGGYTNNLPMFREGYTVQVSPFSGHQDVCPKDEKGLDLYVSIIRQFFKVNPRNVLRTKHALFPPKTKLLELYYRCGYHDAARFLKEWNFYDDYVKECVRSDDDVGGKEQHRSGETAGEGHISSDAVGREQAPSSSNVVGREQGNSSGEAMVIKEGNKTDKPGRRRVLTLYETSL